MFPPLSLFPRCGSIHLAVQRSGEIVRPRCPHTPLPHRRVHLGYRRPHRSLPTPPQRAQPPAAAPPRSLMDFDAANLGSSATQAAAASRSATPTPRAATPTSRAAIPTHAPPPRTRAPPRPPCGPPPQPRGRSQSPFCRGPSEWRRLPSHPDESLELWTMRTTCSTSFSSRNTQVVS